MIRDLIALFETVRTAQSDQERSDRETDLQQAVRTEIRRLFDDPKYPKRRRTFAAIRKPLAIYDNDPDTLTAILFAMGARRVDGNGDDALWELAVTSDQDTPAAPPKRPVRWQTIAAGVGLLALAILVVTNFDALRDRFFGQGYSSKAECLAAANGNMRRISECERSFP